FSSRRRHTRFDCDWSSDVCSSDLADIPAHPHKLAAAEAGKIVAQDLDPPLLQRAKTADQCQERRFPGPRRACHDDELARPDVDAVVEQDLVARVALAVEEIDALGPYGRWLGCEREGWIGRRDRIHQKTSAGSAVRTRRIARLAAIRHMASVRARLNRVRPRVMCSGRRASCPTT